METFDFAGIAETKKAQNVTRQLYEKLQTLCDNKSNDAKTFINGRKVTPEQLARYDEKYKIAKTSGIFQKAIYKDMLKLEADMAGITISALSDLIIANGDKYMEEMLTMNSRIEAFRVATAKLIELGDFTKVRAILDAAKDFDVNTTDDEVSKLFE